MNRKPNFFDKISDFVTGKGFYLVVLVCVAAIALSGYYLVRSIRGGVADQPDDLPVSGSATIVLTPPPVSSTRPSPSTAPTAPPTPKPTIQPTPTPSAQPDPTPTPAPTPAALVFTWPANGTVIASYSAETLSYDETMGDWRTHEGLDIAAALGSEVYATASGTVTAVYEDDMMGTTVVVDHGNGLTSLYANLAAVPTVKVGDSVFTGSVLGSIGRTAVAESGRQAHLHFAMFRNAASVNPEDYLP